MRAQRMTNNAAIEQNRPALKTSARSADFPPLPTNHSTEKSIRLVLHRRDAFIADVGGKVDVGVEAVENQAVFQRLNIGI